MNALAQIGYLSVEEAIAYCLVQARKGASIAYSAKVIIDRVDPEAWRDLAARGLASHVHAANTEGKGAAEVVRVGENPPGRTLPPPLAPQPHAAKEYWKILLAANYEDASGGRKALYQFGPADADHLADLARGRIHGYQRLADAMTLASSLLTKSKKDVIGQLSEADQKQIAEALR